MPAAVLRCFAPPAGCSGWHLPFSGCPPEQQVKPKDATMGEQEDRLRCPRCSAAEYALVPAMQPAASSAALIFSRF
jgi:hypothetical protein